MPRPTPTPVVHFTHVDHLRNIVRRGLLADAAAQESGLVAEVGNKEIKRRRSTRAVPISPGGVVADYAPFYFAPRSPMMFAIENGNVPTYTDGCDDLVYLVSTVERLVELRLPLVFTDRNAVLAVARFTDHAADLDELVDWRLMKQKMWNNTAAEPDRRERRMAECLVHQRVPWEAFHEVVARKVACARRARDALATVGSSVPVFVRRGWYF